MRYLFLTLLLLPVTASAQQVVTCDDWGRCTVYDNRSSTSNLSNMAREFGNQPSLGQRLEDRRGQRLQNEQLQLQNELLKQQLEQLRR